MRFNSLRNTFGAASLEMACGEGSGHPGLLCCAQLQCWSDATVNRQTPAPSRWSKSNASKEPFIRWNKLIPVPDGLNGL